MNLDLSQADIMTAIITPFNDQQAIDYSVLERLTNHLIENGSRGFIIGGTTGETPTLNHDEKLELYSRFANIVKGRVPVIAGTGSNNTQATIEFTNEVSKIQGIDCALVVALEPIRKKYGLKQVIVSTYQAGSGAGQAAMDELFNEAQEKLNGEQMEAKIFPTKGETQHYPLAFNLLPQIDVFEDDGYSHEEWKMIHETKKIMCGDMNDPQLKVTATCVRVPVAIGHGESIYFQTKDSNVTADELRNLLRNAPGITVQDDPSNQIYPQPLNAEGKRDTFVGRIRPDLENKGCFNMWNVADNLLKGAAWNAVQIAECLVSDNII